jgi:hypothetical protein
MGRPDAAQKSAIGVKSLEENLTGSVTPNNAHVGGQGAKGFLAEIEENAGSPRLGEKAVAMKSTSIDRAIIGVNGVMNGWSKDNARDTCAGSGNEAHPRDVQEVVLEVFQMPILEAHAGEWAGSLVWAVKSQVRRRPEKRGRRHRRAGATAQHQQGRKTGSRWCERCCFHISFLSQVQNPGEEKRRRRLHK